MDADSFKFLHDKITPLMKFKSDFNLFQEQFLFKTEKLSLAVLMKDKKEIETIQQGIIKDLKRLPPNLQSVKAKKEQMKECLSDEFWRKLTLEKCEFIKDNFTDLMKHKQTVEREIISLDLDDKVIERKWIQFGPEGEGDYVLSYREKVEKKVLGLADKNLALQKLKQNKPISEKDLQDLEDDLNSPELYITEENLRKTYGKPYVNLVQFLKFILGIYKFPEPEEMVNESFQTYIVERDSREKLSADQLRFLRTVRSVFAKKKHIEYNDFFEPPFTSFGLDAAIRLFKEDELRGIVEHFNQLKLE